MNSLPLLLLLAASPVMACDWSMSDRISPMTDVRACMIRSESARIAISVQGDNVTFITGSAYRHAGLEIRVDDNPAIYISERGRSTNGYESHARDALSQIQSGQRLRVSYRDYPQNQEGDAEICNLPALIQSCQTPAPSHPSR